MNIRGCAYSYVGRQLHVAHLSPAHDPLLCKPDVASASSPSLPSGRNLAS
jgi:hypothetical protein